MLALLRILGFRLPILPSIPEAKDQHFGWISSYGSIGVPPQDQFCHSTTAVIRSKISRIFHFLLLLPRHATDPYPHSSDAVHIPIKIIYILSLPHIDNAADAITLLHIVECGSDVVERLAVGDELINLQLALHVIVDQVGKLGASFDTTESTTPPDTAGDELEC